MKKLLSLLLSVAMLCTMITAFGVTASAQGPAVYKATNWSQVYSLIENANPNDIIDVTEIQGVNAGRLITVNKSITIRGDAADPANYANKKVRALRFSVGTGSTLTIDNLYIEHTELNESAIYGEGSVILNHSIIDPVNSISSAIVYDAPPMINVEGDVEVTGTVINDLWDASVYGATVTDLDGEFTGKAGDAIKARNVTINQALISGGTSFENGVNGGNAIIASGKVTVYGKDSADHAPFTQINGGQGKNGGNAIVAANGVIANGGCIFGGQGTDAETGVGGSGIISGGDIVLSGTKAYDSAEDSTYFDTYVLPGTGGYMPGITIKFTDNANDNYKTRKLIMKTAMVKGKNRTKPNPAAPYIVEMGKNDIAVIDDSIIGWYNDIPLFSNGYYKITNPFGTWGTFANATEIENADIELSSYSSSISATANIPAPAYTVTIPETVNFGEQSQALAKYKDSDNDQYGKPVKVSVPFTVSASNVENLFDDLGKKPQIDVAVSFNGLLSDENSSTIPYTVQKGDSPFTSESVFCSFTNSSAVEGEQKAEGTVWINRANITKTASYTGTMTFTISIPDQD